MTKKLERIRKGLSLLILVTFFLETTVVAEVRMLQSIAPVYFSGARPSAPTAPTLASTASPIPAPSPMSPPAAALPAAGAPFTAPSTPSPAGSFEDVVRLSVSSDEEQGDLESEAPSSSVDGRFVAFQSRADNLVPDDGNHKIDIFIRDEWNGETFRVSVASDGTEADNDSVSPSISSDGRLVAFESKASNLVADDTRDQRDIFVHDTATGETVRVSVASDGSEANKDSTAPSMSGDGRYVAFESKATNLDPRVKDAKQQVFVHDRETGETTLVSLSTDGVVANRTSSAPAMSGNGRYVAFVSKADNLVVSDVNDTEDVFVHDRETGETIRVSVAGDGSEGNGDSGSPSLNGDGRFVAFASRASNLVPGDTNERADAFVHDQETGETARVSVSTDGAEGDRDSGAPSISASGRFVAFESDAANLVEDDSNKDRDVLVHDRSRGLTIRLSVAEEGLPSGPGNGRDDDKNRGDSSHPSISADGSTVAFQSKSPRLVPGDTNRREDVFQAKVGLNLSPEAVDDSATTRQDSAVDIIVLANDTDPDGDTLTVEEVGIPTNGTASLNPDGTVRYVPDDGFSGLDTFSYTVGDGHGGTDAAVVTIEVTPRNQAPSVDAGPDQTITLPTDTVTLTGTVSDDGLPPGSVLTISWSQIDGPAGVEFGTHDQAETTVQFSVAGDYVLRLTASDGELTAGDDVNVQVLPPAVAELSVSDAVVVEGHDGMVEASVEVSLSSASTAMVSVDFSTFDGTARSGCDYLTRFGNLEFEPGELVQTIQVPIVGDLAGENDEDFRLVIGNPVGALIGDAEGMVTIEDDDAPNDPPAGPADRFPANGATGVGLDPTLSWTTSDPDGDPVTHDVYFGTTFDTAGQSWTELCAINNGPGPRAGAAAGYDDANDRLILFSGEAGPGFHPEDIWVLANATAAGGPPTWLPLAAAGGPVGRQQAAAAYDAATNRFMLHGGCTGDCSVALSDTWVLENANGLGGAPAWIRLPDSPVSRKGAAAAFDAANNRLMVFGGSQGNAGFDLDDVWVLQDANGIGTPEWEQLLPTGPAPSARANAAAAYDGTTNRFLVFGGRRATDRVLNDTWVLSGANGLEGTPGWTELVSAGTPPAPRWGHAGVYDEEARRFVVFGGTSAGLADDLNFVANDLWMLTDADGAAGSPEWIQLGPENGPPLGRLLGTAAYSPTQNRMAVVSGKNNRAFLPGDLLEDHWVLANAVGSLPLVSVDQPGTTFETTTPAASETYFWRSVSRDDHGATAGSPVFRFRPNAEPLVDAGADQTIFLSGLPGTGEGSAILNGSASDDGLPLGATLTFTWTQASGPTAATIDDPSSSTTAVSVAEEGTYVFRLTVTDSELEGFDEVSVTFVRNRAPEVDAGDDRVIELPTDTVFLDGTVTDDGLPQGSTLDIQWTQVDGPGTVTFSDPLSEDTDATFGVIGTYTLRLTATDSEFTVSDDLQVILDPVNQPPLVDAGPDRIVTPLGNLIVNPGAEDPLVDGEIPGWTEVSGTRWTQRFTDPFEGTAFFYAGNTGGEAELAQDVDVSAFASGVDAGTQRFELQGYVRTVGADLARIVLEYRDQTNTAVLGSFDSGPLSSDEWRLVTDTQLAPPGTRTIRIRLFSTRQAGTSNDGYFDALSLRPFPSSPFAVAATLNGTVVDDGVPSGGALTVLWSQLSGPGPVVFESPGTPVTEARFPAPGDYELLLSASDSVLNASDPVQVSVVAENQPPAVDAGPPLDLAVGDPTRLLGINLIRNPGNDLPLLNGEILGWREVTGDAWTQRFIDPFEGAYFYPGNRQFAELHQDVDVSAIADLIDTGSQLFHFEGYVRSFDQTPTDTARIVVEYRDATNTSVLDTFDTGETAFFDWELVSDSRFAPPGTRFVRIRLVSTRAASTGSNDGYYDSLLLYTPRLIEVDLDGVLSDDGLPLGAALTSNWSQVEGPQSGVFGDAALEDTTFTTTLAGDYVLRLTASDTELSGSDDLALFMNLPPVVSAGFDQLLASTSDAASLAGGAADDGLPAGGSLTLLWTQQGGPGIATFVDPSSGSTTATFSTPGAYLLRLTANDGELSSFDEVVITVDGVNQPPVVDAGPAQTVSSLTAELAGSATDDGLPAGSFLAVTWSKVSGPGNVTFDDPFATVTAASFDAVGTYVLELAATDGDLTGSDQVSITVAPPLLPPDLIVASLDVSGAAVDAQSREIAGSVTAGIENLGPGDVTETFEVAFFEDLDDNGVYDAGVDNLLGSASQPGLVAGATALVTASVTGELSFAGNLVHAFADSGFVVTEAREDNNAASTAPACEFRPPTAPFAPVLEWSWTGSPIEPNSRQVIMTPAVADLDGDGAPEILFTSYQRNSVGLAFLRVVSGRDGTELFTVDDPDLRLSHDSSLAVGDIDRDGRAEIVAVARGGTRLLAFEHDGTLKWISAGVQDVGSGGPALADLDGDGAPEIVVGRQVLNNDGSLRWTGTGGRGGRLGNPVAPVADLDMDGIPEIVGGRTAYQATGAIYWDHPELSDGWNAVANFDDDPFPEVVLVRTARCFSSSTPARSSGVRWISTRERRGARRW